MQVVRNNTSLKISCVINYFCLSLEYLALSDYTSDTAGDLSFKEGEKVLVYWGNDNGWWYGAVGTDQGWFPGSYVEVSEMYLV